MHYTFCHLSCPCSGDHPGVYIFFGERISLVFLIIRELTGRLAVEMEREEQVMEEYEGGICINISARVLELMQCECHVTCVCTYGVTSCEHAYTCVLATTCGLTATDSHAYVDFITLLMYFVNIECNSPLGTYVCTYVCTYIQTCIHSIVL